MAVPNSGSPKTAFVQAMLPLTPVFVAQLLFAPYQTVAVLPAGSVQVWPSFAQATALGGGTAVGAATARLIAALVVLAPALSYALAVTLCVPTLAPFQL